ncbi:hypothetical protein FPZ12_022175 [Amycolatopsis acidicola]|uniref:DUF3592 domain-containing protein n=1 Tax=Amycolatopsis acidicola TaxID=2596893 RepID=A0A5N0V4C5_9PSEU|nr:DUF3592 domain-containing protein [Amycolatopsis acidicola]KAA9158767.1 hypothetical protein FPZ12_022175 [Amycolatopsis acidicola]
MARRIPRVLIAAALAIAAGLRVALKTRTSPKPIEFSPEPGSRPELAAEIPRLRVLAWRAVAVAVLWLLPISGGALGLNRLSATAQHLLDTGTKVTATVMSAAQPPKGQWSIVVRYEGGGVERTATVLLSDKRKVGPQITVLVDPADPGHVRTPEDDNVDDNLRALFIGAMIAGAVGVACSAMAVRGWSRRYAAVMRTGWRSASVAVHKAPRTSTTITACFPEGETLQLRETPSTHNSPRKPRHAWIGGHGTAIVVLYGRDDKRPLPVPARPAKQPGRAKGAGLG